MNKVTKILGELFGKSQKAVSEKLSTEEFNDFAAEVTEIDERLAAQQTGNVALQADLDAANLRATDAEAKVTALEAKVSGFEATIQQLEAEKKQLSEQNTQLQSWVDAEKEKGKGLPDTDANAGQGAPMSHSALTALQTLGFN